MYDAAIGMRRVSANRPIPFYVSELNKVGLFTDKSGSCPCSDRKTPKAPCSRTPAFVSDSLNVVAVIAAARVVVAAASSDRTARPRILCLHAAAAAAAARLVKACVVRGAFQPTVART
mgnify:CR=1 FL=1